MVVSNMELTLMDSLAENRTPGSNWGSRCRHPIGTNVPPASLARRAKYPWKFPGRRGCCSGNLDLDIANIIVTAPARLFPLMEAYLGFTENHFSNCDNNQSYSPDS
jgi:hypothetical protein